MDNVLTASITATDTRAAGHWVSADGQSSLDMTGETLAGAKALLLAQSGSDADRIDILAGSIQILAGVKPNRIDDNTFAAACYNDCSVEDLEAALVGAPDPVDCRTWNLTEVEWRAGISAAIAALRADAAE